MYSTLVHLMRIAAGLLAGLLFSQLVWAQSSDAVLMEVMQQLGKLEEEVRQLRGQVEMLQYELKTVKGQQRNLYLDIDQRLKASASGTGVATTVVSSTTSVPPTPAATPTPPGKPVKTTPVPTQTAALKAPAGDPALEQKAYKDAFRLLKEGRYDKAVEAFEAFLGSYPNGKFSANAQYWLGETNYVRREFRTAITAFRKVVEGYPQSRKVPDALLKIGYIHYELQESAQARKVFEALIGRYSGTTPARLAENRLQRMKLEGR